jgi:hypothetical protein
MSSIIQADEGADRRVEGPPVALIAALTNNPISFAALADIIAPQGKLRLIDDPTSLNVNLLKGKAASLHWNRCSPDHRSRPTT